MKKKNRPQMLLALLVGALLLSTGLNFYFLLRLDGRVADQELEAQLQLPDSTSRPIIAQQDLAVPLLPPDTVLLTTAR